MSWFFKTDKPSKATNQRKRKAKGSTKNSQPVISPATRRLLFRCFIVGSLAVTAVAGWYITEQWLSVRVGQRLRQPARVELVNAPAWMNEQWQTQLRNLVASQINPNPLDDQSLQRAADALATNPWISQVRQIRRLHNGRIQVTAAYRQPIALVCPRWNDPVNSKYYLIDRQRHCLSQQHYVRDEALVLGLPIIRGVVNDPPRSNGTRWPGKDLQAGLDLLQLLWQTPYAQRILEIDVQNYAGRTNRHKPHLSLITDRGEIAWGRPPHDQSIDEPSVARKLEQLERVIERPGRWDISQNVAGTYLPANSRSVRTVSHIYND